MQQQGTVISINMDATINKKDNGGTYKGWELIYKDTIGEVKILAKPIQSLTYNKPLGDSLKTLKAGDEFTLSLEKNAGGFWEVKTCEKGFGVGAAEPQGQAAKAAAPYVARDYESKEEREKKQVFIVRQSAIAQAVALLGTGAKVHASVEDVLKVASQFEDFVFGKKPVGEYDDFQDDIPL